MSELESCPFCGDDADDSAAWYTTPMTGGCINSDCPGFLGECITVTAWNRRSEAYELGAAIIALRGLSAKDRITATQTIYQSRYGSQTSKGKEGNAAMALWSATSAEIYTAVEAAKGE